MCFYTQTLEGLSLYGHFNLCVSCVSVCACVCLQNIMGHLSLVNPTVSISSTSAPQPLLTSVQSDQGEKLKCKTKYLTGKWLLSMCIESSSCLKLLLFRTGHKQVLCFSGAGRQANPAPLAVSPLWPEHRGLVAP